MASACALAIFSGKIIFYFGIAERPQTIRYYEIKNRFSADDGQSARGGHSKRFACKNGRTYFFRWLSQPLEVVACLSGVHHMASTPSSDSTSFCPSSSGIQNRAVVRQSAMPESGHSTVTPL